MTKTIASTLSIWIIIILTTNPGFSQTPLPDAMEIVEQVNARDEGEHVIQNFNMILVNSKGKTQKRETKIYRKDYNGQRKSIFIFTSPTNVKDTGFMSFDYHDYEKEDDQWLYLPALKRTRRISASNRGDYFLGTDFTYEDIKLGSKISASDFDFTVVLEDTVAGSIAYLIESIPKNETIKKELGYSKVHHWVDPEIWMIRKSTYWDVAGNLLKTTRVKSVEMIDGIWTINELAAYNHKTEHETHLSFSSVDYNTPVDDDLFTEASLMRGVR